VLNITGDQCAHMYTLLLYSTFPIFLSVIYQLLCQSLSITEEGQVYLVCILVGGFADMAGNARGASEEWVRRQCVLGTENLSPRTSGLVKFFLFKLSVWP